MITYHRSGAPGALCPCEKVGGTPLEDVLWIDLLRPSPDEELELERKLGIDVPTRDEIQDIATSSRLYQKDGCLFMTATILTKSDSTQPESSAVLFILTPAKLITVRYAEPSAFELFRARRDGDPSAFGSPARIFEGLADAIVERVADILENVGNGLDQLSPEVFSRSKRQAHDFRDRLERLGRSSDLTSKARESLLSLSRLLWFFEEQDKTKLIAEAELSAIVAHIATITRDIASLNDHATFLSGKIGFLLEATLGLINVEQNAIIKIFSVAAVIFLPPTLVASIYGMNFEHMPELRWMLGYPLAVALMITSAILPFYFFKRKGWL